MHDGAQRALLDRKGAACLGQQSQQAEARIRRKEGTSRRSVGGGRRWSEGSNRSDAVSSAWP